ncbi:MAG: leucyl aminopeptidase [Thermodesulfobacteriota bacterium]|nr:leucyl aminopeptidase [Thermodesulfobacteriota bacterium]
MALFITKSNNITNFKTTYHVLLKTELNKTFSIYGNLKKQISHFAETQSFEGNYNESLVFNDIDNEKSSSKKFIGLGVKKELNNEKIFRCASSITYSIVSSKQKISSLQIVLPDSFDNIKVEKFLMGLFYGHYYFDKYKSKKSNLNDIDISIISNNLSSSTFTKILEKSKNVIEGVNMTRLLVNEQPEILTPAELSKYASKISKRKNVTCEIFNEKELKKMNMLGIWNVGKGSANMPRFIHLKYKSGSKNKKIKKIALIGKGMTYDSGGLSLKPADYMVTMKMDMAGAGCVVGVFEALSLLQPKNLEVHGLIPSAENMPGPNAYRPDDVVVGLSGKSIEVINTDAEGRVILSDAIEYANRLKVSEMIDLATLTGACMVALGNYTAGLFSNTVKQADKILKSSQNAGEKIWELPLDEDLRSSIESNIADIKNSASTRYGGAITAAMFLQHFVDKSIPWSHIDIAGPAYIDSKRPWLAPGATGFGVMTLLDYLGAI